MTVCLDEKWSCPERLSGWLYKLTNQSRGYQKRWFVISNGVLSYYRTQEEMAHTCRGTVNLAEAFIDTIDWCHFVITNGASQVFHLRASNEIERQRWVTALELAKAKAIKMLQYDDSDDGGENEEHDQPLVNLKDKLRELTETHDLLYQLVLQYGEELSKIKDTGCSSSETKNKLSEKVSMFKLATGAMVKKVAIIGIIHILRTLSIGH